MTLLLVTLFGALGCAVRFLAEYAVRRRHPTLRPWATVFVNVVGTALAGWVAYRLLSSSDAHLRSILLTGFCGGLTTFSSAFAVPAILQKEHHVGYSVALIVATPLLCGLAFLVGMSVAS
jgi:CrcB protein